MTEQIQSIFEQAGQLVPAHLINSDVKTIFKETNLDWTIKQKPVYSQYSTIYGSTRNELIPNMVANYRSDNNQFLGMVHPNKYKVVENVDAFDFIDKLPNFEIEKVGMFNDGRKVFVVGKANEQIDIDGTGDFVNFYLTFLHGHDGKSGIRFIICPIRMFCTNQLNLMLKAATFKHNIAHTGNIEHKLAQIYKAIADSKNYIVSLQDTINNMINTKVDKSIEEFVIDLVPTEDDDSKLVYSRKEEIRSEITNLYYNKPDLQNYKGTSFGVLSAVSDYISHAQPKRMESDTIANTFIRNIEGNALLEQAKCLLAV